MSRLSMAAALSAALVATACGPKEPLDVNTQTMSLSLLLGKLKQIHNTPVGPPGPGLPPLPPFPSAFPTPQVTTPLPSPSPTQTLTPADCPMFDPGRNPVQLAVGRTIPGTPPAATYDYAASTRLGGAGAEPIGYDGDSTWKVTTSPVTGVADAFDVTYAITAGKSTSTRVFRVLPHDVADLNNGEPTDATNPNAIAERINNLNLLPARLPVLPNYAEYGLAGIYLVSQKGNGVSFEPAVPMAILQLRQLTAVDPQKAAIVSVGLDPVTQSAMAFRSTVVSTGIDVNACGDRLQGVQVSLSSPYLPQELSTLSGAGYVTGFLDRFAVYAERDGGTPLDPKANVFLWVESFVLGLQYGGLLLHDDSSVLGAQLSSNMTAPPVGDPNDPKYVDELLAWAFQNALVRVGNYTINQVPKPVEK